MVTRQKLRGVLFGLGLAATSVAEAAVFWLDNRLPYAQATDAQRQGLLDATGAIECADGHVGSGFLVDISEYIEGEPRLRLVVTSAKVLYRGDSGASRAPCAFRPAAAPGQYLPIGERIFGSNVNFFMDRDDWAFATIQFGDALLPRALKLRFPEKKGAVPLDLSELRLSMAGVIGKSTGVGVVDDCTPSVPETSSRSALARQDNSHVLVHNCDAMEQAIGGPVAMKVEGTYRVIAIHTGSSLEERGTDKRGIPFDPQRNFFNHSRRLDIELENKLVAFISRFAEVRSASAVVKARRLLILAVQQRLAALEFDPGPVDGRIGFKTVEAIKSFQTTLGITPTGFVSEELLLLLNNRQ